MKKILHLASDEKFINAANFIFEKAFPKQNEFWILLSNKNQNVNHVKRQENVKFYTVEDQLENLIGKNETYGLVVLHGIDPINSQFFLDFKGKIPFLGMVFGYEIYCNPQILIPSVLGDETQKVFGSKRGVKQMFRKLYYKVCHTKDPFYVMKRAITGIQYIGSFKEDFDFFKVNNLIDGELIEFCYYPIDFIFKNNEDLLVNNNNILLGNSSSKENNHLEAFDLLRKFNLENRKVITPLSYGDNDYRIKILKEGNKILDCNFEPLTEFLPLEIYNKLMQQCGIVIMNHYRQQAVGNTLAMLWMGAKVYLDERNSVYHYLKRLGIKVYSINKDLKVDNPVALVSLSQEDVLHNRKILSHEISSQNIIQKLRDGLSFLNTSV